MSSKPRPRPQSRAASRSRKSLPLFPIAPFFTGAAWSYAILSYRAHKRAHLEPEWAKRHVPWHYDHHMGPDQDANWCTLAPWFDILMGTRRPYLGTERQRRDEERARARCAPEPHVPVAHDGASPGPERSLAAIRSS